MWWITVFYGTPYRLLFPENTWLLPLSLFTPLLHFPLFTQTHTIYAKKRTPLRQR